MTATASTATVAFENSLSVFELLQEHPDVAETAEWTVQDVPLEALHGPYSVAGYVADEREYLERLEVAYEAGGIPLPAFVCRRGRYHHADGAHRTVLAMLRGDSTIRAYVHVAEP